jgi:hypothetical protein
MRHIRFGELQYEALLYEWGLPSDDKLVIGLCGHYTLVHQNLQAALLRLTEEEDEDDFNERYIWIDALSIDQANNKERNHQVKMMRKIYQEASKVLVWIPGPDLSVFVNQDEWREAMERISDAQYSSAIALCQASYWRRMWVQQEVFSARESVVYCRFQEMTGEEFNRALGILIQDAAAHNSDLAQKLEQSPANSLLTRKGSPSNANCLVTWLRMAYRRGLETSEPRDLIYAMLGVSSDCQEGGIGPDYNKPLLDVYLETVSFCGLDKSGQGNKRF